MKEEDRLFLIDPEGRILLKDFKIWETLAPFMNSRMKKRIPKLKLVLTGGWKESDIIENMDKVGVRIMWANIVIQLKLENQKRQIELEKQCLSIVRKLNFNHIEYKKVKLISKITK